MKQSIKLNIKNLDENAMKIPKVAFMKVANVNSFMRRKRLTFKSQRLGEHKTISSECCATENL